MADGAIKPNGTDMAIAENAATTVARVGTIFMNFMPPKVGAIQFLSRCLS